MASRPTALLSVAAAIPLVISIRDSFYSLCKVQGSSMEPTLKDGDILLMRKADFPVLRRWGIGTGRHDGPDKSTMRKDLLTVKKTYDSDGDDENENERISNLLMRSRRLREYEYQDHVARESSLVWFRSPPWPMKGQIVTYRSPYRYPTELCIKRVVGVAGQVVSIVTVRYVPYQPLFAGVRVHCRCTFCLRQ